MARRLEFKLTYHFFVNYFQDFTSPEAKFDYGGANLVLLCSQKLLSRNTFVDGLYANHTQCKLIDEIPRCPCMFYHANG